MKTPESWQLPSRRRELEQGKAPREVTFCLDERDQAEYRRRWLEGEEISDIRRDIAARKEAAAKAATASQSDQDAPDEPPADKWRTDLYGDSGPRY